MSEASGGCLCGRIRYRIRGELRDVVFCHCSRCRRTHGHIGAYTECARQDLELLEAETLRWFEQDGRRRGFCSGCGASLFWERDGGETVSVAAGTLDGHRAPPDGAHLRRRRGRLLRDRGRPRALPAVGRVDPLRYEPARLSARSRAFGAVWSGTLEREQEGGSGPEVPRA